MEITIDLNDTEAEILIKDTQNYNIFRRGLDPEWEDIEPIDYLGYLISRWFSNKEHGKDKN